jgi:Mg2+ and Co2+ transporter CorA
MSAPLAMTLKEQAEFLEYLAGRVNAATPGTVALEAIFWLSADEANQLAYCADRLRQMVPHANDIRALVVGR